MAADRTRHAPGVRFFCACRRPALPAFCLLAALSVPTFAAQRPLWELGAGVFLVTLPAYPGAKTDLHYLLPYPYVVYRGRFLKTTRSGVSGVFVNTPRLRLDVSASASPPVNSHKASVRQGMPDLQPAFQIGPQLILHLYHAWDTRVDLHLALRAAETIRLHAIGWVASPYLTARIRNWRRSGWNLSLALGPNFADQRYNQYFYGVPRAYATASRPAYTARAGYAGTALYLGADRALGRLRLGAYVSYTDLNGAAFADSPLVQTRRYLSAGLRLAWVFAESRKSAQNVD